MIKIKQKKALKVKRKMVRSKTAKKKTVKKKAVKKKVAKKKAVKKKAVKKKAVKKKAVRKKTAKKRKKRKKIYMDDIYSIINKVQFGKKKTTFVTDLDEAPTIENNIRDVDLEYDKVEMKTQVVFTIYPNDEKYDDEIDFLRFDIMDDEIPDIGQIFG